MSSVRAQSCDARLQNIAGEHFHNEVESACNKEPMQPSTVRNNSGSNITISPKGSRRQWSDMSEESSDEDVPSETSTSLSSHFNDAVGSVDKDHSSTSDTTSEDGSKPVATSSSNNSQFDSDDGSKLHKSRSNSHTDSEAGSYESDDGSKATTISGSNDNNNNKNNENESENNTNINNINNNINNDDDDEENESENENNSSEDSNAVQAQAASEADEEECGNGVSSNSAEGFCQNAANQMMFVVPVHGQYQQQCYQMMMFDQQQQPNSGFAFDGGFQNGYQQLQQHQRKIELMMQQLQQQQQQVTQQIQQHQQVCQQLCQQQQQQLQQGQLVMIPIPCEANPWQGMPGLQSQPFNTGFGSNCPPPPAPHPAGVARENKTFDILCERRATEDGGLVLKAPNARTTNAATPAWSVYMSKKVKDCVFQTQICEFCSLTLCKHYLSAKGCNVHDQCKFCHHIWTGYQATPSHCTKSYNGRVQNHLEGFEARRIKVESSLAARRRFGKMALGPLVYECLQLSERRETSHLVTFFDGNANQISQF